MAGAAAALYGPLHGGANEAVLRMLTKIGTVDNVPAFVDRVKSGAGRLMGFGHRVYKSYDPRAKVIKAAANQVFEVTGRNPLLDVALELERIALEDDYFISRKLYPNVDFYSGLIYQAMGSTRRCSPCCSPSAAPPAGSRSGRSCCPTRAEDRPAPGRSTSARTGATTFRSRTAEPEGAAAGRELHTCWRASRRSPACPPAAIRRLPPRGERAGEFRAWSSRLPRREFSPVAV